jgi:hypothetical protein
LPHSVFTVNEPPYCGALAAVVVIGVVVVVTTEVVVVEDVLVQDAKTMEGAITAIMSRLNPILSQNFFVLTSFSLFYFPVISALLLKWFAAQKITHYS